MIDQLRMVWNRPLRDRDRRRLFVAAATVIAAAATGIVLLAPDETSRPAAAASRLPRAPRRTFSLTTPTVQPAATPTAAPSEEGAPPAALTATPADVAEAKHAARTFLAGYLPYSYGHRSARHVRPATAALRRELDTERPRVPDRERARHPRLVLVQTDAATRQAAAITALVDDGARRYNVQLELANTAHGWTITAVGN